MLGFRKFHDFWQVLSSTWELSTDPPYSWTPKSIWEFCYAHCLQKIWLGECGLVGVDGERWESKWHGYPSQGLTWVQVSSFPCSDCNTGFCCPNIPIECVYFSVAGISVFPLIFSPLCLNSPDYGILRSLLWVWIGRNFEWPHTFFQIF